MRYLPVENEALLTTIITATYWALSVTLYGSIMLSLSYIIRRRIFAPFGVLCIIALAMGFTFGISLGLNQWKLVVPEQYMALPLGEPGVILTQANTSVVLLNEPKDARGPRVTAFADRPLLYQAEPTGPNNSVLSLPPLPLGHDSPWFLRSIAIDFRLNSEQLSRRFDIDPIQFFIYAGSLIFFLASLGFIFKLSRWPLANLFTGTLIFRLILSLETFLNSPEMQDTFLSFIGNRLPAYLLVPLIFCAFGFMVYTYSILVFFARKRSDDEDFL